MFKFIEKLFPVSNKLPNVLVGTAIGDALGIPFEGMRSNNKELVAWDGKSFKKGNSYAKTTPGQCSDDTDMSLMVAESLTLHKRFDPNDLVKRYIGWIYSGKNRGVGKTTRAAIENLHNGVHWSKSGIEGSFGNGTAMRAAPFGVFFAHDFSAMFNAVRIDSAITHKSVEAEAGALAIAISVYLICNNQEDQIPSFLSVHLPESKVKDKIFKAYDMAMFWRSPQLTNVSPAKHLAQIGTSADVRDTVPAALYCLWAFDSFERAVVAAIRAGRDCDTTASIVGAMFGAKTKLGDIPKKWVKGVEYSAYLQDLDTKLSNR